MSAGNTARSTLAAVGGDRVRALQHVLYRAAKADPKRRFHVLFDKVHRMDVLDRAWREVRRNGGASGIDRVSLVAVEEYGVSRLLDELAAELREGRYRCTPAGMPGTREGMYAARGPVRPQAGHGAAHNRTRTPSRGVTIPRRPHYRRAVTRVKDACSAGQAGRAEARSLTRASRRTNRQQRGKGTHGASSPCPATALQARNCRPNPA